MPRPRKVRQPHDTEPDIARTREDLLAENDVLRAQIAALQQSKNSCTAGYARAAAAQSAVSDLNMALDNRMLAEAMPQLVCLTDPNGNTAYVNRRWLAYTGTDFEQAKEGGWLAAIHPDDCAHASAAWSQALQTGVSFADEARLRHADGLYRWHLCHAVPARDSDGTIIAWYFTATDIDDQKRMLVAQHIVGNASALLAATTAIVPAMAGIVRLPVPQFAHWCSIDLYIEGQEATRTVAYADDSAEDGVRVIQHVLPDSAERFQQQQTRTDTLIPSVLLAEDAPGSAHLRTFHDPSVLYVPLKLNNRLLGAITLIGVGLGKGFDRIASNTFEGVARRIVASVENAQLTKAMTAALRVRDQALAEADSQRRYFYDLLMDAPIPIHILRGPEHVIEFVNTRGKTLFGNRDVIGKALVEVLAESDAQTYKRILDQVYTTGKPYACKEASAGIDRNGNGNLEHMYLNLVYQPIRDGDGRVTGIFSSAVEVTDQVLARQRVEELASQLGQQAAQLNAIIEAMPDGVYVCDAEARLTMVNAKGAEVLGLPANYRFDSLEEAQETVYATYLDGSPIPFEAQPLIRALRGETGNDHRATIHKVHSDEEIHLRFSYAPIRGADNTITGAVSIASDITALHHLEQQKDAFLSIAAHELKTPITSIKGQVQMAARRLNRGGQVQEAEALLHIDKQINRLTGLINELTDVSRIQSGKFEMQPMRFDFAELLRSVTEALQSTTNEHRINITAPDSLELTGDPDRLEQVVTNLVGNAIKYSPDGGMVWLTLEQIGNEALLSVADEGIGIPPIERPHLFERFHRASNAKEYRVGGFGLGLYICGQIVQAHKGRIWLCDTHSDGHGSTFCVALPLA